MEKPELTEYFLMNSLEPPLCIGPQKKVTLHFSIALENGQQIDSTFKKKPASFVFGDESLLPGFESAIIGLKAGDKRSFFFNPEQAFGEHNPDNVRRMPKNGFSKDISLEEGLIVSFADVNQAELPGVIKTVGDNYVIVDFNHPLAGKDIHFKVDIIDVEIEGAEKIVNLMSSLTGNENQG